MSARLLWLISLSGAAAVGDAVIFIALPLLAFASSDHARQSIAAVVAVGSGARLISPLAGRMIDRCGPKWPLCAVLMGKCLIFWGVAAAGVTGLTSALWLSAVNGLSAAVLVPASATLIVGLATQGDLARANSLNGAAVMALPILGYALAPLLIDQIGTSGVLTLGASASLGLVVWLLMGPTTTRVPEIETGTAASTRPRFRFWLVVVCLMSLLLNILINTANVRAPLYFLTSPDGIAGYGRFEVFLGISLLAGLVLAGWLVQPPTMWKFAVVGAAITGGIVAKILVPGSAGWMILAIVLGGGVGVGQVLSTTLVQARSLTGGVGSNMGMVFAASALGLVAGSVIAGGPVTTEQLLGGIAVSLASVSAIVLACGRPSLS